MRRVYLMFLNTYTLHRFVSEFKLLNSISFQIELHDLIRAGVVGFKCFLIDSGVEEFPHIEADELEKVFAILNGTGTVLAVST